VRDPCVLNSTLGAFQGEYRYLARFFGYPGGPGYNRKTSQGPHDRVAAVPRTLVEGLFSEPRRSDDSCGRAPQARPQEPF